ncbi:IPT/TIG domain-containing protein [uncultured Algibacter sp.]|uniref:IPT/TIG domain-containing protein n=1 Tax=uncultured Algibacter sp. TaxID=298659 RepID=UPI003217C9D5
MRSFNSPIIRGCNYEVNGSENTDNPDTGIFPTPFITEIEIVPKPNSDLLQVTINGFNFDVNSVVKFNSNSIVIVETQFVNPMQIIVCIEASQNGTFDVVVCNNTLTSGKTGNGKVIIRKSSITWIDFCELSLNEIEVEATKGVQLFKDLERGIWAGGTSNDFFGRGVKFPKYIWKRADELEFSFVFTVRGTNPSFLFGIGTPEIEVNNLGSQALFASEIQLFYDNGRFNRFLGGGRVRNWAQDVQANLRFEKDVFYKVTFKKSGKVDSKVCIHTVEKGNYDVNLELIGEYTVQDNPANNPVLIPYWNAVKTSDIFIAALGVPI